MRKQELTLFQIFILCTLSLSIALVLSNNNVLCQCIAISETMTRNNQIGIGLNALLPFNTIGKVEWAFRVERPHIGQLYLDLEQSFNF